MEQNHPLVGDRFREMCENYDFKYASIDNGKKIYRFEIRNVSTDLRRLGSV